MTSKERVKAALEHKNTDNIPTGEWETLPSVFCSQLLGRQSHLGFWSEEANAEALWSGRRDDVVTSVIRDSIDIVRMFDWDIVHTELMPDRDAPAPKALKQIDAENWSNDAGDRIVLSQGRYVCIEPGDRARQLPYLRLPRLPGYQPTESEMAAVDALMREFGNTHFMTTGLIVGPPGLGYSRLWGREDDWIYICEHPEEWVAFMLEETDIVFGLTVEYAQKNNFDGIIYGHDFGHNGGTFISPSLFKDTIARVMARRSDILHEAGFKHILHACGNNRAVMDMLIDAGVDVYQSIQPEMPIAELKKSFGDRLTLWGGVTAELLLAGASETELRQCCRKALVDCAEDNGGFIYGTSHSVMPGAIPVKYQIMIEELKEWNDNKQRGDNEHLVMGSPIECGRTTLETC